MCPPQGLHKFPKKRNVFSGVSCCPPQQESQHGLPRHVPLFASSIPAQPPPPRPLTRPPGLGEKEMTTHSFTTFSTTAAIFPAPFPQAGRPGACSAQAPGPNGGDLVSLSLCAGAARARARSGASGGEPAWSPLRRPESRGARRAGAMATGARPSLLLEPCVFHLEERERDLPWSRKEKARGW